MALPGEDLVEADSQLSEWGSTPRFGPKPRAGLTFCPPFIWGVSLWG